MARALVFSNNNNKNNDGLEWSQEHLNQNLLPAPGGKLLEIYMSELPEGCYCAEDQAKQKIQTYSPYVPAL